MLFRLDSSHVYRAERLEQFPWLQHGFGTRLSAGWPDAAGLATAKQIHSDQVLIATQPGAPRPRRRDHFQAARRDCRNSNGGLSAVRHCGSDEHAPWPRFTPAGAGWWLRLCRRLWRAMRLEFGSRPEDLEIAIGPGIGPCCFEVGPEVAAQFRAFFPERTDLEGSGRSWTWPRRSTRQLRRNGVTRGQIEYCGFALAVNRSLFESYRRDREQAGRMVTAVGWNPLKLIDSKGAQLIAPPSNSVRWGSCVRLREPECLRANRNLLLDSGPRFPGTGCSKLPMARRVNA